MPEIETGGGDSGKVTIPGTKTKVPRWTIPAVGIAAVVGYVVFRNKGAAAPSSTGPGMDQQGGTVTGDGGTGTTGADLYAQMQADRQAYLDALNRSISAHDLLTSPVSPVSQVTPGQSFDIVPTVSAEPLSAQQTIIQQYPTERFPTSSQAVLEAIQSDRLGQLSQIRASYPDVTATPEQDKRRAQRAGMTVTPTKVASSPVVYNAVGGILNTRGYVKE